MTELEIPQEQIEGEPAEAEQERKRNWDDLEAEWFEFGTEFLIF